MNLEILEREELVKNAQVHSFRSKRDLVLEQKRENVSVLSVSLCGCLSVYRVGLFCSYTRSLLLLY